MTLKAAERQLPQFISVTYEVGSRGPDPHTSPSRTDRQNQYLTERKVPNRQKHGWAGTKHLKPVLVVGKRTDSQGNEKRMKMIICMQSNMNK